MSHSNKLWQLIDYLSPLQKLSYNNPMIEKWEKKVLEVLEQEYGQNSEHYQQFLKKVQLSYWHFGKADPRGSMSTPYTYQKEYEEDLSLYRSLILSFLNG